MSRTALQQFSYHQWPNGQAPILRFKQGSISTPAVARQLNHRFDLPAPNVADHLELQGHHSASAPLPCIWDPVHMDYFCYEPETTCYVYSRLGRVHYDPVKREHYRHDAQQRLTFATTYPKYRVYESGEVMFWDPCRKDWYQYDMDARRILWRDQRHWPFPQKFNAPSLNSPSFSPIMPISNMGGKMDRKRQECPKKKKKKKPRVVEVALGDPWTATTRLSTADLSERLPENVVTERGRAPKHSSSHTKMPLAVENITYEMSPRDRIHKYRRSRGSVFDLQYLVDETASKRKQYSWF